tara:strand:+ start:108 stop:998 length:891 start_codon:yes stop_codon:yes gene_type:complete
MYYKIASILLKSLLLFIILCNANSNAQSKLEGIIKDSITKNNIPFVNVAYEALNVGTMSNNEGYFNLKKIDSLKFIQISSVGYESKRVNIATLSKIIYLRPKIESLEEVVINSKQLKYTKNIKLGLKQTLKIRTGLPFGYEFSSYIENTAKKRGLIKEVILNLNKAPTYDFLATYNVKFYNFDSIKKQPGKLIYNENIFITPENRTYILKIDVEKLRIKLPIEGICIGIEVVNKENYKITSMSTIAPKINFTHTKQKYSTWLRFMNKNWILSTNESHAKKGIFVNANINITALIEN